MNNHDTPTSSANNFLLILKILFLAGVPWLSNFQGNFFVRKTGVLVFLGDFFCSKRKKTAVLIFQNHFFNT